MNFKLYSFLYSAFIGYSFNQIYNINMNNSYDKKGTIILFFMNN